MLKVFFYIQNEQWNTIIFERSTKMEILSSMNHSVIFTQIHPKLPLYTKWAKAKPKLETSTF